jgi:hypothetical protein
MPPDFRKLVSAAALLAAGAISSPPAHAQGFRAGAASRTITPDLNKFSPVYIAGFGKDRKATGVHDELLVGCLALSVKKQAPLILCGFDSIGIFWDDTLRVRKALAAKGVAYTGLVLAPSHSHQSPDTMGLWGPGGQTGIDEAYITFLIERIAEAAADAAKSMNEARIRLATIRDPEFDTFIDDDRPPRRHDSDVIALEVWSKQQPIATLVNWANHPESMGSRNTLLSADYVTYLRSHLEKLRGAGMVIFANGALGGMQSPLGSNVAGFKDRTWEKAEHIGRRVAIRTHEALQAAPFTAAVENIEFREKIIQIPLKNEGFRKAMQAGIYGGRKAPQPDGSLATPVGMFRLRAKGGKPLLECALVPGELYPELSLGGIERYSGADFPDAPLEQPIKAGMMKAPHRMLFGLANDENGYIIPVAEWDDKEPWLNGAPKRWYGEVNSIGPDAAPAIARALAELLLGR